MGCSKCFGTGSMGNLCECNSAYVKPLPEFIIEEDWRGWGVWVSGKDYKKYNALAYFRRRHQAEEFEYELQLGEKTKRENK